MARPHKSQALDIPRRAVDVTIELLSEKDALTITLAEVAAKIGCRAPALYNHFRNRNALFRAVHDEGFLRLYADKRDVQERNEGDVLSRLRDGGHAYLEFAYTNPALYRLMFFPPRIEEIDAQPFASDPARKALEFLRDGIVESQRLGYLPGRDPDEVAFTLWSTVHGAALLSTQDSSIASRQKHQELAKATVNTIMALIVGSREV